MALSQTFHDTNGTTQEWDLSLSGGYLAKDHVKAYFYPTGNLADARSPVTFTWVHATRIRINPALAAGGKLLIQRETPKTDTLVQFTNTADLTRENLMTVARQGIFVAAEVTDQYEDPELLGAISDAKNAAETAIAKSAEAASYATQAGTSRTESLTYANNSATSASASATSAGQAATSATAAAASATTASGHASTASSHAAAANTAAVQSENARDAAIAAKNAAEAASLLAMPVGSIIDFGGETPPTGWFECDGAGLLRSSYPALFAAIGTLHGALDSTLFNIPDHRGKFKRGWAHGTAYDPDRATRYAARAGGASGDHVGSQQDDQIKAHTHAGPNINIMNTEGADPWSISGGAGGAINNLNAIQTGSSGGNQTNPVNVYTMSIIRYA